MRLDYRYNFQNLEENLLYKPHLCCCVKALCSKVHQGKSLFEGSQGRSLKADQFISCRITSNQGTYSQGNTAETFGAKMPAFGLLSVLGLSRFLIHFRTTQGWFFSQWAGSSCNQYQGNLPQTCSQDNLIWAILQVTSS